MCLPYIFFFNFPACNDTYLKYVWTYSDCRVEYKVRLPVNEFLRFTEQSPSLIVGGTRANCDHGILRFDTITTSGKQRVNECRSSSCLWLGSADAWGCTQIRECNEAGETLSSRHVSSCDVTLAVGMWEAIYHWNLWRRFTLLSLCLRHMVSRAITPLTFREVSSRDVRIVCPRPKSVRLGEALGEHM